jgi:uncharacterized pyridoxal phosphate-containing UPF0001 family protein
MFRSGRKTKDISIVVVTKYSFIRRTEETIEAGLKKKSHLKRM